MNKTAEQRAEQYWKDHQLWQFIKFNIWNNYKTNEDEIIGAVEHNGWKFFITADDCIHYATPNGEEGYFIVC